MSTSLTLARAVADAVLYEGYLLYPYRASSQKNRTRWQFGILGPPGAAASGVGEETGMFADTLLRASATAEVEVHLRFLQLQSRTAEIADHDAFTPVDEVTVGSAHWLSWDEATECEITLGPFSMEQLEQGQTLPVDIAAGLDIESLHDAAGMVAGRLVRRRSALHGLVRLNATVPSTELVQLRIEVENTASGQTSDKQDAIATSFIGAHLLLRAEDADFISLLEPPEDARAAAANCQQNRCWPVLAGPEGLNDVLLVSPIILYDHPAVAPQSSVALYDSTEIDEILTLRVLTLTEEEKIEARATDPRAAAIIDLCEAMTPEEMQQLHGVLLNPHGGDGGNAAEALDVPAVNGDAGTDFPWWTEEADTSVQPDLDAVVIDGISVARGSMVKVNPNRRADAQDLFFDGRTARVTSVHFDVDGSTHVGLVLEEDPASDLHDEYGRSFYFAPDELTPLEPAPVAEDRAVAGDPAPVAGDRKES